MTGLGRHAILFEPVRIGPVVASNRFYAVPHATGHGWSQPNGAIGVRAMKARGGWGTVIAQMTEISPSSDLASHQMDRLWDACDLPVHEAQVQRIKECGALAGIELAHGGMRSRNFVSGVPVLGPSDLPILRPEVPIQARAMDRSDIWAFRDEHRRAVRNAVLAGYDIIYVYAAHDLSLLSHFLSRRTNHRTDEYGGSFENRLRLLREVLEDTLEVVGGERAVALRFSVSEPGKSVGLRHDGEGREVVEALAELPDLWDVNISGWDQDSATSRFSEEGFQLPFTSFVKEVTTKPVVGVGRFTSPDLMASLVRNGTLDLIGAARPSIADPYLPTKIREGRHDEICECIGCNICVSMEGCGVPIRCTQNPTIGEEWRRDWHPESVRKTKRKGAYLVIGSGPAGLECALTLLRAGCSITIAEREDRLGGRVALEATLPGLAAWSRVRDYRLSLLRASPDVEIYLDSDLSTENALDVEADGIVVATGAVWRSDGVGSCNLSPLDLGEGVLTPDDVLRARPGSFQSKRTVVYDDDHYYMASAIAERLALEGSRVDYVTPLSTVAAWTDLTLEQGRILDRFGQLGIGIHVNFRLCGDRRFLNLLTGEHCDIPADRLVVVGARSPNDSLHRSLLRQGSDGGVWSVGDCRVPATIQAAVYSGHRTAREILDLDGSSLDFRRELPQVA